MAQNSLYYRAQFETKVTLLPKQIDGNLSDHILENLRMKVEKKTTEDGIIIRVNNLVNFRDGIIDGTNSSGSTVFTVKYDCFVCSPTRGLEIVCSVENMVKGYIIGKNGPVVVAISFENIDSQYFKTGEDTVTNIKTGEQIKFEDYLKVSIINIQSNLWEKEITMICKLLNFATDAEISAFEMDQKLVTGRDVDEDKQFI